MKKEEQISGLLSVPAAFLIEIDLFENVLLKYIPELRKKCTPQLTIEDVLPNGRESAFLEDMKSAAESYQIETLKEIREFGVDIDPADPRYDWGSPEKNETAVRSIEERYPVNQGDVICYGPSNMTLWYSLERDLLPYRAQNHGMGGCTDEDLIRYAPRVLYPYRPSVVIMQTGSNDIASGIPLDQILLRKKNMYDLFLREMPETKLIVCSGLPLPGRRQFWDATQEINQMLKTICGNTERLIYLDATDVMLAGNGEERYKTSDGRYFNPALYRIDKIHLNKKGHDIWTALMKSTLALELP